MDIAAFVANGRRQQTAPPLGLPSGPQGDDETLPVGGAPLAPAPPPEGPLSISDFVQRGKTQQQDQARLAVVTNAPQSATTAAEAARLAPQVGMPQTAVETDLPRFQAQARAQRNADLVGQHPMLAAWVAANPDSARVAQEEFEKLGALEKMWTASKDTAGDMALGTLASIGAGTRAFGGSMLHILGAIPETVDIAAGTKLHQAWEENIVGPQFAAAKELRAMIPPGFLPKIASAVGQAMVMMAEMPLMGPAKAATALTGGLAAVVEGAKASAKASTFPALAAAVETGRDVYEKTGDYLSANAASATAYLNTVMQVVAPASAMGSALQRVGSGALAGVVTGEGGRALMNVVLPAEMRRHFDPEEALVNAIIGGIFGGVLGPRAEPEVYRAARETYREALAAGKSEAVAERLVAAAEVVKDMKVRDAAPDAFREFARSVSEDGDVRDVWVSPKPLADALQQAGIDPVRMGLAEHLRDAALTGEDVRVPVAEYLTHISGTPAEQALLQHLKADPAGPTYAEAQAYFARDKAAIKAQAERVAQEKTDRVQQEESERAVREDLLRQFSEAQGAFRSANMASADLQLSFYKALAKREGKTVEEVWREAPLRVEGAAPPKRPEALVQHRKRVAVLEAIRECL
jgi:hypothetical protein